MTGITQMVLTQSETIAGYRGNLANSNSLVFGQNAPAALTATDVATMSSLNLSGINAINTSAWTLQYWVNHSNIQFNEGIVHNNGQAIVGSTTVIGGLAILHVENAVYVNNYLITNAECILPTQASATQTWQRDVWYNVVVSKNTAGQITSWINGYRTAAGIIEPVPGSNVSYNFPPIFIGTWRNTYGVGTTNNLIGKLYNLQLVVGRALYDFTSTQITVADRSYSASTTGTSMLLLSRRGQTFIDSAGNATLSPRAGTVNFSASTPFHDEPQKFSIRTSYSSPFQDSRSGSYYFFGRNSSYASYIIANNKLSLGTGDFCIEWFGNLQNIGRTLSTPWWFETGATPIIGVRFETAGSNSDVKVTTAVGTSTLATIAITGYEKQWTHWALVRISGLLYFYKNGVLQNVGGTSFTDDLSNSSGIFYIGKKGSTAVDQETFYGYITNLRIATTGTYTGNFTTPTNSLLRLQTANYYSGTNTQALASYQVPLLMVP